ncbi:MAG TPA: pyridoxal-phosphate dependent enzyme [Gammaproteobacteria bacterium]|nr:pyridoxal-phosphate dependent enzyme [Gammaproteobacteria bacterium]
MSELALAERYPALAELLPTVPLGAWPTPVQPAEHGALPGPCAGLWLKRDDRCATPYGGNKVRKLEFLLADALRRGHEAVFTFGVAGSNHALATAIYAQQLGLEALLLLTPQSNSSFVGRNLKLGRWAGARQLHCATEAEANRRARILELHGRGTGPAPYRIPGGGSSPLGTVGFVNAGLELAAQVRAGLIPEPDDLYVALGTMGTAAGLALGLAVAGLRTRLVLVRVVRADIASPQRFRSLYHGAARLLHQLDPRFPRVPLDTSRIELRHEFIGPGYARFTAEGMAALAFARQAFDIGLEGTYTGKALAALLADLRAGRLANRHVLFWNTYNGQPMPAAAMALDYRELPPPFHRYFETPFQPLDPQA